MDQIMWTRQGVGEMVKKRAATQQGGAAATTSKQGNLAHLKFRLAVLSAEDTLDLTAVARLLRDPTTTIDQADRERLAELLVPVRRGARVRGRLEGRAGRSSTVERDIAFYQAQEAFRIKHNVKHIPAAAKAEIASRFGIHDEETARKAAGRGKRRLELERLGHWASMTPDD